ncbi:60Kd inner membrane protein-domain-containing protein [Aspergillus bertholletiae]|uniref:60Kd inner membrane protein-domain-containing protein n=1 Tax=Aspergillus bertholletiae TaxID=1226010 RepID=A0A5N7AZD5_9EURO|nr:60Kd inner membrane protein-domain-containing protein [Aspergillus bertholletiae]
MRPFHRSLRAPRKITSQQIRHFHPTRPSPFVNELLDASSTFIQGVHSISGLTWAVSIPLTALIVRSAVAMPLQIYTKTQARKERDLVPLLSSWKKHYKDDILRKQLKADDANDLSAATPMLAQRMKSKHADLKKRWNIPKYWKPLNFLQIPIWISVMEALRAMSGNDKGLIPYLLSLVEPTSSSGAPRLHLDVEPSLATEGALWFPDLLAGDTTGILPAALTMSILLNISAGWKAKKFSDMADLPKIELYKALTIRGIRGFIQVLALNVGISSYYYEMPAALLLYWITSTNVATLQTVFLEKFMFKKKPLKPWKQIHIGYTANKECAPEDSIYRASMKGATGFRGLH